MLETAVPASPREVMATICTFRVLRQQRNSSTPV
jgi:hypothetical protein